MTLAKDADLCNMTKESHRIDWVAPDALPIVWPQILPFLEKSLDRFTPADIAYQSIALGRAKLWIVHSKWIDGVVLTGVDGDLGVIAACGGENIKDWIHLREVIENDFRAHGCSRYQYAGRKGWAKLLKADEVDYLYTKVL